MRTFITYLLSALFLLFFAETKVLAGTLHSQESLTSQTAIQPKTELTQVGKFVESKITTNSHSYIVQELSSSIEQNEDDLQSSYQFDFETCAKLLSLVFILTFLLKGLREKHIFYNKSIKFSSCKYIMLRTIRI
jgi:predicted PurR-regulated permease PerM